MSLRSIVQKLGGDAYSGYTKANIPAPGHSKHDRSVSLTIGDRGQVLARCFSSSCTWQEVLDHLRAEGLIDRDNFPTGVGGGGVHHSSAPAVATDRERVAVARKVWELGRSIAKSPAGIHHARRAIDRDPGPDVVRFAFDTPVAPYGPSKKTYPAMLVAVRDHTGEITAVEITYLDANGYRTNGLRLSRKTIGKVPTSSACRIDQPAERMLVGEGYFTTLSATRRFRLPGWALMSTANLRHWTPPEIVREVLIAGDRGKDGEASAYFLRNRLRELGLKARVEFPPEGQGDWNDIDKAALAT